MKNAVDDREGNQSYFSIPYVVFTLFLFIPMSACNLDYQGGGSQQGACWRESFLTSSDQALWASRESHSVLTRDLQSARASIDILKEELEAAWASATTVRHELSSKSMAFDELVVWEREAQNKLQILCDEKNIQEQLLEFA
jgi:hypothetical protein